MVTERISVTKLFKCGIAGRVNPDPVNRPARAAANAMAEIFIDAIDRKADFIPSNIPQINYNEPRGTFNVGLALTAEEMPAITKLRITKDLLGYIVKAGASGSLNKDSLLIQESFVRVLIDVRVNEAADFTFDK